LSYRTVRRLKMARLVQARLDEDTEEILRELRKKTKLSESELVRRGLRALSASPPAGRGVRVIGVGKFAFGKGDLATNKKYLEGFGKK
jgi:hypothetical protein